MDNQTASPPSSHMNPFAIFSPNKILHLSPSMGNNPTTTKRRKLTHHHCHQEEDLPLIPTLPDQIAQLCLSHVHPFTLYSVCRSWRRLIYSPSFPPFHSLYTLFSSKLTHNDTHLNTIHFSTFDPISSKWYSLPPPPPELHPGHLLLRHPSFISRSLPVQSISVCGQLILLAATTHNFFPALSRPLIFNPLNQTWAFGPPLAAPRRWCAAGAVHGAVYVASGIGSHFSIDVARSVEKWDLRKKTTMKKNNKSFNGGWRWEKMRALKDGRFCRDAIDAVGWRGKLCMVNVKGDAAKEGVVYDVEGDMWLQMPDGMLAGWRGPVAAMDEEVMYAVDESKGVLRKYHEETDSWEEILESNTLKGAKEIAAGGGRVCVVCGSDNDGCGIVVVDVVAEQPRLWLVDPPSGFEAMAVHIMPRMSQPATALMK